MKIFKILILIVAMIFWMQGCKDVMSLDPNIEKELIHKKLSSTDSLSMLQIYNVDFGSIKVRSVNNTSVRIVNKSELNTVTIYSIKQKNTSGLFEVTTPKGLPFAIKPGEDIEEEDKIHIRFIADVFNTGEYNDTLIINDNAGFYIAVKVKVRY